MGAFGLFYVLQKSPIIACILVFWGFYNKIPQNGWFINSRNLLITVLKGQSLSSGCQYGQVRIPLWVADFFYAHMVEKAREHKSTNPIHEGSTVMT